MAVSVIKSFPQVIELANKATLLREGRKRTLILNNFYVGSATLTIPASDRPNENVGNVGLRRAQSANGSSVALVRVNTSGTVDMFYASAYGNNQTAALNGDMIASQVSWII